MNSYHEKQLPKFVCDMLSCPPSRGEGLHNWLFRTARVLHPFRSRDEIIDLLDAVTHGEPVKPGEIESAVDNSLACAWTPGGRSKMEKKPSRWSALNEEKRSEIIANGAGLSDLWDLSPYALIDNELKGEAIIEVLFPGNPLLCCGFSSSNFSTRTRLEWGGDVSALQLIVPSPMTSVWGETKDGKKSQHTLSNTGPRRFLVVEQDQGTPDEQASVLVHLAARAPLVLAVHSGSKSIHGWFYCEGRPEENLRRFMDYAVSIGADRATWTRSQFVRMPDGMRDNGNKQLVYFYNPEVLK